ncbi:MAG: winged helix-turn-helix transcriptional regulator [Solirubrobacterales bacterium]|nr:winged helix-turn-helix transcriptional regulator [Solirubrobacterales bacterium]
MTSSADSCELLCLDLPKAESIRESLPALETLTDASSKAKALADPNRLGLAIALRQGGEMCVCDLSWVVGRQDKIVSHHLRLLKSARVATSRKDGKMVLYSLTESGASLLDAVVAVPANPISAWLRGR